ncbi:MAG: ribose 5-phosphate isomerase B [Deltaproteobacteria bacterium]
MKIAVASDHAGCLLKQDLKSHPLGKSLDVLDLGTHDEEPCDYPVVARAVGEAIRKDEAERAVLVCGSGVGACVAANKIRGVRGGLCHDTYSAHQGVEHDDINVLCLGARVIGVELARELVRAFLSARFTGEERHRRRLAKVVALETENRDG